jgi:diguanylate cyclase (GGDEF)-like protein
MSRRRLTPKIALLLVLECAVISALVASNHYFQGQLVEVHERAQIVVRDIERIRYYDEALTGSARLGASTGDPGYERRYHELAPELDGVITQMLRLADSRQASAAIDKTSVANQALIKMEERSFALTRRGRGRKALALLISPEYLRQKQVYAQGFDQATTLVLATVRSNTERVSSYRRLALGIGVLGGVILLVAGTLLLRLSRERERLGVEQDQRRHEEADRRAVRLEYSETQHRFSEILQVTREEPEAHSLVKRHLERTIPGASVAVLKGDRSGDRLKLMTEVREDSALCATLEGAAPDSCAAIRLGRAHARDQGTAGLLECEICGDLPGSSLCTPSLVGGDVIGSVLVESDGPLRAEAELRVQETVAQAAPVMANLRNLAAAESRALTDTLTGLANKRSIEFTLARMVAQAGRSLSSLAAIMLDLDHFKQINDRFGHDRGDLVLAAVGPAIVDVLRESDFAGRYGGEEFLILLPDTGRAGALETAERLRTAMAALRVPGESHGVTASLGVAVLPDDAGDSAQLLRRADRALYAAKQAGRNRVESTLADVVVVGPGAVGPG